MQANYANTNTIFKCTNWKKDIGCLLSNGHMHADMSSILSGCHEKLVSNSSELLPLWYAWTEYFLQRIIVNGNLRIKTVRTDSIKLCTIINFKNDFIRWITLNWNAQNFSTSSSSSRSAVDRQTMPWAGCDLAPRIWWCVYVCERMLFTFLLCAIHNTASVMKIYGPKNSQK